MMMYGLAKFKYLHTSHIYEATLKGYMMSRKTSALLQQTNAVHNILYSIPILIYAPERFNQSWTASGENSISWDGTVDSYIAVPSRVYVLFLL
jgi:hypothetical protein